MSKNKYTEEFKRSVAEYYGNNEMSYKAVGEKFNVNPTLVRNWHLKYSARSSSPASIDEIFNNDDEIPDMYELIDEVSALFHDDPKNKAFASEQIMLASIKEEAGEEIDADEFHKLIQSYDSGTLNEQDQDLFDAAMYACSLIAKACFADDPEDEDEEVDYSVSFIENEDNTVSAEIRPD